MKPRILEFIKNNPDTWEEKSDDYSISKNTINMMDAAISNLKDGHVSDWIL